MIWSEKTQPFGAPWSVITSMVLAAAGLVGCAASSPAWVGSDVAALYREKGPPDTVVDDPTCAGCRIHVYVTVTSGSYTDPDSTTLTADPSSPSGVHSETRPGATHSTTRRRRTAYYTDVDGRITDVRKLK